VADHLADLAGDFQVGRGRNGRAQAQRPSTEPAIYHTGVYAHEEALQLLLGQLRAIAPASPPGRVRLQAIAR
jgi:hypothetical protein